MFVDPDGADNDPDTWADNDYRLDTGSPCVDKGDDVPVPVDSNDFDADGDVEELYPYDLDRNPRILCTVDMGAYEVQGAGPPDPPGAESPTVYANRYLSFVPGNPGVEMALRVKVAGLPDDLGETFQDLEGTIWWVGQPGDVSEVAGSLTLTPTFKLATLGVRDTEVLRKLRLVKTLASPS
jgi:hypothetical protein